MFEICTLNFEISWFDMIIFILKYLINICNIQLIYGLCMYILYCLFMNWFYNCVQITYVGPLCRLLKNAFEMSQGVGNMSWRLVPDPYNPNQGLSVTYNLKKITCVYAGTFYFIQKEIIKLCYVLFCFGFSCL